MVIILGSVLGGLLLLSLVFFCNRRTIVKRFKIVKAHLWPKIPGPENFLAPPSSEEDYYQELDHVPPFVYLPPEPEMVDDIAEERRKLLASLPEGSSGGANSGGSNLYASVGRGSRVVSTATDGAERSGHDASCHGSSEEVAGITTVPNEPVSMSTEGDDALILNARAINNYVQVDHSSRQVTLATGGAPLVSSGNGTGGSRVMQNYTQVYHRGYPVDMVTEGDKLASFELAETTPREVGTTVWMSQPIQDYVQSSSNVAMATAGAHAVSFGAAARDEKVPPVGKNGELSAAQHMNDYVQSTNVQVHKDCPHH
ncbi:uncharacterized protein LOC118431288 [Branchiostoma floridae]|uniref:Uncharacterized protein LOC118431288 n=1 Tax=Branchiostoma floridae TaxID=7739 RepID=C3YT09_BRAFL|nr:uncharacterized protein LOC118431288 [Branchiostoma floridae]|eukprot:XP_002600565.1 hypothetical protein BRAFLDRAFT_119273 [Branchiostoma floridae]